MSLLQSQPADPVPQAPQYFLVGDDLPTAVSHHTLNPAFSFETERKAWQDVAEGDVMVRTWKGDYFDTHSFYWVVKKNAKSIWVQALDGDTGHYVGQRERVMKDVAERWSRYYFKGGHAGFVGRVARIAGQAHPL